MLLTVAQLALASEPTTTPFAGFDAAAAAQALQGTWPVTLGNVTFDVTFTGNEMTMKLPNRVSTNPFSAEVPCAITIEGEVGGGTLAYALQDGKLEMMGGFAVKSGDRIYGCMANYVFDVQADGSCVSWTWSQDEGKPREWTNSPATCSYADNTWTMKGTYGEALKFVRRSDTFWAVVPPTPPAGGPPGKAGKSGKGNKKK